MENLKNLLASAISLIASYFMPVQNIFIAIAWMFVLDFICGYVSGKIAKNEKFDRKKAFKFFIEASAIFLLMASIFFVGERIGNIKGALQCISGVVYAVVYFYGCNILKNLNELFPENKLIKFLYYIISIEFVKEVPFLSNYNKKNEKDITIP
jgi:hypothetical protein